MGLVKYSGARWVIALAAVGSLLAVAQATDPTVGQAAQAKTVFYYGDSLAFESAGYARSTIAARSSIVFVDGSFPGTSPCDWTRGAKADLKRHPKPDAVMIETLGNNLSPCQVHGGKRAASGSAAYWEQYRKDLDALIALFPEATPIWLDSPPPTRYEPTSHRKARMLRLMREIASVRPLTWVVDSGAAVEGPRASYATHLACLPAEPCSGSRPGMNRVRALDGVHFCPVVRKATIKDLRKCPVYASGARRFGVAQGTPVADFLSPLPGS